MLETEYPKIQKEIEKGCFAVQEYSGYFTANSLHMHLEKLLNNQSVKGIVEQTKHKRYITEWELVYHKALGISSCFTKLSNPKRLAAAI